MESPSARRSPPASAPVGASFPSDVLPWEDLQDEDAASQVVGSDFDVDEDERFWTAPVVTTDDTLAEDAPKVKDIVNGKSESATKHPKKPKKVPLRLLDLPVDVLEMIMREITHTNDMCSLTLTCSTLHRLAIPVIYSRFDIVWPDNSVELQPRTGVDALTFGLATLVMGNELFNEPSTTATGPAPGCSNCEHADAVKRTERPRFRRRGNDYARHVRKFSLGNGPAEWVRDYTVGKEAGKMLGTLVALAVGRMRNLETFSWDMPTGVIRDVWMSLSSLGDRHDASHCRLERVHIRWHNNWESPDVSSSPTIAAQHPGLTGTNAAAQTNAQSATQASNNNHTNNQANALPESDDEDAESYETVEHPTFSLLPPLKAISVLDIDELPYLDEMKVLIGRSKRKLRELRVGIADHVIKKDWVSSWEGQGAQPVSADAAHTQTEQNQKRIGGVLGILFSQVDDLGAEKDGSPDSSAPNSPPKEAKSQAVREGMKENVHLPTISSQEAAIQRPRDSTETAVAISDGGPSTAGEPHKGSIKSALTELLNSLESQKQREPEVPTLPQVKLMLDVLELERVPLSPGVMIKYLDWTRLTRLTLLGCYNTDSLWRALAGERTVVSKRHNTVKTHKPRSSILDQGLALRELYTDGVTPALISFLKDALKPNTLEILILQWRDKHAARVDPQDIYKGPIRRHRASLQRVSIDSSQKNTQGEIVTPSLVWDRWTVSKEIFAFLLSAKMPKLRELCISINQKDWHFLLQQLPRAPQLRALYIPFLKRLPRIPGNSEVDAREHALQIVDVAALRPEVKLTYIGISWKCFEILEVNGSDEDLDTSNGTPAHGANADDDHDDDDDDEGDEDAEDEDDDEGADDSDPDDPLASVHAASMNALQRDDSDSDISDYAAEESKTRLKLREILFYDDKVMVFKARHGRL